MTYYYWGPGASGSQFYQPQPFFGQSQMPQTPSTAQSGNMMTPTGSVLPISGGRQQEESYIENILRENIGVNGTFYFTFAGTNTTNNEGNTVRVRGTVLQAGRDHAVIREDGTNHVYLFPMIYFDYARFEDGFRYITSQTRPQR